MNILAAVANLQYLRFVARAFALFADEFNVRQKLHFDGNSSIALARFTPAAGNIEREMPGTESTLLRFGKRSEQIPDGVECLDIGHGVRPGRSSNGRLVDQHDFVNVLVAVHAAPCGSSWSHTIALLLLGLRQSPVENLVKKRRLARPGDAGNPDEHAQRNIYIDPFEIGGPGAANLDLRRTRFAARDRHLDSQVFG